MISFCLKSINKKTLDELEHYFNNTNLPNIFYSQKKFRKFYNLIIHYTGKHIQDFYNEFSKIISSYIIDNYENKIINNQLKYDFFYFSAKERNEIYSSTILELCSDKNNKKKRALLEKNIIKFNEDFFRYNIDGFINFRIFNYKNFISSILEKQIHNYVVKKEYLEYVNLLRKYIQLQGPQTGTIHLIYTNNEKFLLDESGNIITTTESKKYLSDISFSTNDFILNSILSLMPEKIIIHLHSENDSFIQFLKLIFEHKCTICLNCNLCGSYIETLNHSST